jgi:hypothetical protein
LNRLLREFLCPNKRLTSWAYSTDNKIKYFQKVHSFFFMLEDVIDREFNRLYFERLISPERYELAFKVNFLEKISKEG